MPGRSQEIEKNSTYKSKRENFMPIVSDSVLYSVVREEQMHNDFFSSTWTSLTNHSPRA